MVLIAFIILIAGGITGYTYEKKSKQSKLYKTENEKHLSNELEKENPVHVKHYKAEITKWNEKYYKYNNRGGIIFSISLILFLILIMKGCN